MIALIGSLSLAIVSLASAGGQSITEEISESNQTVSGEPLWTVDLGHRPILERVIDEGDLLVVTDSAGISRLQSETGVAVWTLPDIGGMTAARWIPVQGTTLGCLLSGKTHSVYNRNARTNFDSYYNTLDVIDIQAGTVLWNARDLGYESVHGFFFLPPIGGLLVYGRDTAKRTWATAVSLTSGEVLWRCDTLFGEGGADLIAGFPETDDVLNGQQSPIIDTDSTMILCMDGRFIRKVRLTTGEEIWRVKTVSKDVPARIEGYAAILCDTMRGVIYIPQGKTLLALHAESGARVWDTLPKLPGRVYQMELVDQGLLVAGGPDPDKPSGHQYVTMINLENGARVWADDFKKLTHQRTSNLAVSGQQAWIYSKGDFWKINLSDGAPSLMTNGLDFGDQGGWPSLELRDSMFLVTGTNSLARITLDGAPIFSSTYKAPPAQFGIADVVTIAMVAASVASIAAAASSPTGGTYFYPTSFPQKFSPVATEWRDKYMYILTNVRDSVNRKPGLVKVNRETRVVEAAIKLDDRSPQYTADEQHQRLYYVRDGHILECYEF